MTIEKFEEKWNLQIDHRGRGFIERNGERLKNAKAVTIHCEAGELPRVTVTFNASDIATHLEGAHGELAISSDQIEATEKIAQLRHALIRLHVRSGCADKPGSDPTNCSICRDLVETAA